MRENDLTGFREQRVASVEIIAVQRVRGKEKWASGREKSSERASEGKRRRGREKAALNAPFEKAFINSTYRPGLTSVRVFILL